MARATKKEVKKVEEVKVKKTSGITGIKEESEKGELFFKVVLIIMAAGLLAIGLYFLIDTIIDSRNKDGELRYHETNYITLADVQRVINLESYENVVHEGFRYALDNYDYVYVLFMTEDDSDLNETSQKELSDTLAVVDEIFGLEVSTEKIVNEDNEEYTIIVINGQTAIFFVEVKTTGNEGFATLVDTTEGQASAKSVPVLLEINQDTELEWYGPRNAIGQNVSSKNKLTSILEGLK